MAVAGVSPESKQPQQAHQVQAEAKTASQETPTKAKAKKDPGRLAIELSGAVVSGDKFIEGMRSGVAGAGSIGLSYRAKTWDIDRVGRLGLSVFGRVQASSWQPDTFTIATTAGVRANLEPKNWHGLGFELGAGFAYDHHELDLPYGILSASSESLGLAAEAAITYSPRQAKWLRIAVGAQGKATSDVTTSYNSKRLGIHGTGPASDPRLHGQEEGFVRFDFMIPGT